MSELVGGIHYDVSLDTRKLIDGQRVVNREVDKAAQAFNRITQAVKLYAAAMALVKSINMAEDLRLLRSRVDIAAGSVQRGADAMRELEAISRRTQSSIEANATVFTRLNASILQMGGTQRDTLQITELLAKAIKVSGASAVESKAAMLQFAQALGSGKLAGDELRSLMENAPYLMRQLADGLGVPIGALKKLGEEGKLTADVVVNALSQAADRIDRDFQKVPATFGAAMTAMEDAAARANEKLDTLTGASAVATGAVKGLNQVLDALAQQFEAATTESDKLGRNKAVETWADRTTLALSYLLDAADVVWQTVSVLGRNVKFVFEGVGTEIGGIGAQIAAVMRGDFAQAKAIGEEMKRDAETRRRELDAKDQETLRDRLLAGQKIRQQMQALAGTPELRPERVDLATRGGTTKLRPPAGAGGDVGTKAKFDAVGYLIGLQEKAADGYARINAAEREQLHKAEELRRLGKISAQQFEEAKTIIVSDATEKRKELWEREKADALRIFEDGSREIEAQRQKQQQGQQFAQGILLQGNPIAQLEAELQAKSALLLQYAEQDQANADLYAAARVALEEQTNERIRQIREQDAANRQSQQSLMLQGYGSLFGNMADLAKAFGGEQSRAYKAMFAVSKAFAIADSIIKIQQGIAAAAALPFPANIPAMASVAAATAGIVATIQGTQFGGGRQYGGPVSSGSLYRINETGRPEMFTAANGSQYMLPTANGSVTPASEVGAGGAVEWKVIVNNNAPGAVASASVDRDSRVVTIAVAQVAEQIANNSGPVWSALRGSSNVQGRM